MSEPVKPVPDLRGITDKAMEEAIAETVPQTAPPVDMPPVGLQRFRPALSAEEWAMNAADSGTLAHFYLDDNGDLRCLAVGHDGRFTQSWHPPGEMHGIAALCLDGQPSGFTWAMLDALEECVKEYDENWNDFGEPENAEVMATITEARAAIDRIAALLRPRKEETE